MHERRRLPLGSSASPLCPSFHHAWALSGQARKGCLRQRASAVPWQRQHNHMLRSILAAFKEEHPSRTMAKAVQPASAGRRDPYERRQYSTPCAPPSRWEPVRASVPVDLWITFLLSTGPQAKLGICGQPPWCPQIPSPTRSVRQPGGALVGPTQRRVRIAARHRIDQPLQAFQQLGVGFRATLATATHPAQARTQRRLGVDLAPRQLRQSLAYRVRRQTALKPPFD